MARRAQRQPKPAAEPQPDAAQADTPPPEHPFDDFWELLFRCLESLPEEDDPAEPPAHNAET